MDKLDDDAIYEVLTTAIAEHHLSPETHLPEDELAVNFNVSRTRIRKVLQRLAGEQLIVHKPNRGAFVASLTVKEAQDIFAARRIVESGLIGCIPLPLKKNQINRLRGLIKKEAKAIKEGDNRLANRISGEFHLTISELANNDSLYQYLEQLIARTSIAIAIYQKPGAKLCDNCCHSELVDLLTEGDSQAIQRRMCQHLIDIEAELDLQDSDPIQTNISEVLSSIQKGNT